MAFFCVQENIVLKRVICCGHFIVNCWHYCFVTKSQFSFKNNFTPFCQLRVEPINKIHDVCLVAAAMMQSQLFFPHEIVDSRQFFSLCMTSPLKLPGVSNLSPFMRKRWKIILHNFFSESFIKIANTYAFFHIL